MMDAHDIVKALSETRQPRATLYLNERVIDEYFSQRLGAIQNLVAAEKLQPEISASLGLLGVKLGGERATTATLALNTVLKAILVEYDATLGKQLVDLNTTEPRQGIMLRHVGTARIFDIDEEVAADNSGFPGPTATQVEQERQRQQKRLQVREPGRLTIVWATATPRPMASIASDQWVSAGTLASYHLHPPYGILGRFESRIGDVSFIAPFWIWHEGW